MANFILLLFGLSGAAGLTYQVVWARQILLIFGNTTYSTVTILSVFMAGLALGSAVFGLASDRVKSELRLWGLIELGIGTSALFFLLLLPITREFYTPAGLATKFAAATILVFPATFFMGGTLPVLIKYFSRRLEDVPRAAARLYFINTFGAFLGTLASAFILIEILGLFYSVVAAAISNFLIGVIVLFLVRAETPRRGDSSPVGPASKVVLAYDARVITIALLVFFLSGAISFSYEVIWTRLLLFSLGTYVYAFATILAVILFGISLGAVLAGRLSKIREKMALFGALEFGIGLLAVFSLLAAGKLIDLPTIPKLMLVLLPASVLMGVTFPVVASIFKDRRRVGFSVGGAYAINTAGSIVGPIVCGFVLIPTLGVTSTLIFLAGVNILGGALLVALERRRAILLPVVFLVIFLLVIWSSRKFPNFFIEKSLGERIDFYTQKGWPYRLFEDEVATSLAFFGPSPAQKGLIIDGVQTTTLTLQTKLLAHLPLLLHPEPQDVLVIAFGMGTTFRSALAHNVAVDAVELVPSVPKTFSLFYPDGKELLRDPRARLIINDGRNYVLFADKIYDVIVVDPPPPINAAGTTVLYSQEFYQDAKKILRNDGIFVQWFWYGASEEDFKALFQSFKLVFANILVAVSPDGRGVFFLGSHLPLKIDKQQIATRLPGKVAQDLNEWEEKPFTAERLLHLLVGDEQTVERFVGDSRPVSDNFPITEYFYLRHRFSPHPDISADWVHPISEEFKQKIK